MRLTCLSASRIKTFDLCKFKYYMSYDMKVDLGTNWGATHGTMIHHVLERYAAGELDWESILLEEYLRADKTNDFNPCFVHAKVKEYTDVKKKCEKCPMHENGLCKLENKLVEETSGCGIRLWKKSVKLITTYLADYGDIYKKPVIGIEKDFNIEFAPGKFVRGFIDFLYEEDDSTICMIDYKTAKKWEKSQNFDAMKRDIQARIYAMAMQELFPDKEIQLLTFHFFNNRPITLFFNSAEIEATRVLLGEVWDEIIKINDPKRLRDGFGFLPRECKYLCDEQVCSTKWKEYKEK